MGLGSHSNFPLWVQKDASFYQTERRDSLAREETSITPQKHHNKNNHHGLLLPPPSPMGKGAREGSEDLGQVLPSQSPPTASPNEPAAGERHRARSNALPSSVAREGARKPGGRREVTGRASGGKVCAVLAASGGWGSGETGLAPPPRSLQLGAQRASAP